MARWEGFSEEDIKRVIASNGLIEGQQQQQSVPIQVAKRAANITNSAGKKNVTRSRMLQKTRQEIEPNMGTARMPKEAFLSKPQEQIAEESQPMVETNSDSGCGVSPPVSNTTTPNTSPSHGAVCLRIKEGRSYEVLSGSSNSLDEFQVRQKMMEEVNRRKKELLVQEIAARKKQTKEEARRLQQIQDELQKLDMLLSNDVSILRNQIEAASLDFMEAQKRYNKAEKEFLDAKLLLFEKLERKEMLTEHLCTIIEQNEIRKARKLSELMQKLDISAVSPDPCEDQHKNVILSPLCALDEVSYTVCNTLKPRKDASKSSTTEITGDCKTNNENICTSKESLSASAEVVRPEDQSPVDIN
ncbi:hypothetical protein L9F63_021131 [Diploptera punctata]|uniref:RAB6-interacting golgin n=1 Tax=Diploptera punctata TaxID=6984 RepID=A0AAD7ZQ75_DIPPU|nr:hypothetical protein L9F63_021131 [Diploptera punctata]